MMEWLQTPKSFPWNPTSVALEIKAVEICVNVKQYIAVDRFMYNLGVTLRNSQHQ